MITLDGVMQAPGEPKEDTEGGFKYGGWMAPYGDAVYNEVVQKETTSGPKSAAYDWPKRLRLSP